MSDVPPLDPLEVYRATCMLLSDRPGTLDALLFHAKAHGDESGLMDFVAQAHREYAACVAINGSAGEALHGTTPGEAWPGADVYEGQLFVLGVRMCTVERTRPSFHTRDDNDAFLELARKCRWQRVAIIGHAHQILRAFLGMVRAMAIAEHRIHVFALAPPHTNWRTLVHGSQGSPPQPRAEHIAGELDRIARYQAKGDLASFEELDAYLTWRDSAA